MKALAVLLAVIVVLAIFGAAALVSGLIIWLLWNEVITTIVNDNGGSLNDISYWLAVGVGLVLSALTGIFRRN